MYLKRIKKLSSLSIISMDVLVDVSVCLSVTERKMSPQCHHHPQCHTRHNNLTHSFCVVSRWNILMDESDCSLVQLSQERNLNQKRKRGLLVPCFGYNLLQPEALSARGVGVGW